MQSQVTSTFTRLAEAKNSRRAKASAVLLRREAVRSALAELKIAQRELKEDDDAIAAIEAEFAQAQAALKTYDDQAAALASERADGYRSAVAAAYEELPGLDDSLGDVSGVLRGA